MLYNPFEQLTLPTFRSFLEQGYCYFVLQRFGWPDVSSGRGFLLSRYWTEEVHAHASELGLKEVKAIQIPTDVHSVQQLLEINSVYRIFINRFWQEEWDKHMLCAYKNNIVNYLRSKNRL
jgi:hypothetical protein